MCFGVTSNRCFSTRILSVGSYRISGLYIFPPYLMTCFYFKILKLVFLKRFSNQLLLLRDCLIFTCCIPEKNSKTRFLTSTTPHSSKFQKLIVYRKTGISLHFNMLFLWNRLEICNNFLYHSILLDSILTPCI